MAQPNSRQSLIDYCLRRLGAPVIEINVDPDQIEDCIDDAFQYFQEFHQDASNRTYLKHTVTAADVINKYIPISPDVMTVVRLLPPGSSGAFGASSGMFSVQYQVALNDMASMQNFVGNLDYYVQMSQYLDTLDMVLNGTPQVTFSRYQNRLEIHGEWWDSEINEGDILVCEVYQVIDPDSATSVYNNKFIKAYTTSLIKHRWGQNMSKFEGMQLPGGVMISGERILGEAQSEIEQLEEKMRAEYEPMPDFFVG